MSLNLPVLLCVSGLVGCSSAATVVRGPAAPGAPTTAHGPFGAAAPEAPADAPVAQEFRALGPISTSALSSVSGEAGTKQPTDDAHKARTETNDEADLAERRRIRQGAMADGLL